MHRSSGAQTDPAVQPDRILTDRQIEILYWVQEGKSAPEIGTILGISGRTVDKHLENICDVLGVRRRLQAVIRARELRLLGESRPTVVRTFRRQD
jgi:DNA-binding CsgD family transcriptional regulator